MVLELPEDLFGRHVGHQHRHQFAHHFAAAAHLAGGVRRENVRQPGERLAERFGFLRGVMRQAPLAAPGAGRRCP